MSKKIVVFVIEDSKESDEAIQILRAELPGVKREIIPCPPSMRSVYVMPFLRYGDHPYYGLSGIRAFVRHRHEVTA